MADEQFGYAVRQEDKELLGKIDEGLKKLMATPYWGELKKKYLEAK
jgi:polar amino acid transport system substrate-binding protein